MNHIKLKIISLEWGRFQENVKKGGVDIWLLSWVGFKDPTIYNYAFSSNSFPPKGANRGKYKNIKLDNLLNQGKITNNEIERKKIINKPKKDTVT